MARNRYLVTSDVTDDRRRTKLFNRMKDFGDRVQFSVFSCDLNAKELVALRASITKVIHHGSDQVLVVNLGPVDGRSDARVETLGRPLDVEVRTLII